jgi:hypothetical protein
MIAGVQRPCCDPSRMTAIAAHYEDREPARGLDERRVLAKEGDVRAIRGSGHLHVVAGERGDRSTECACRPKRSRTTMSECSMKPSALGSSQAGTVLASGRHVLSRMSSLALRLSGKEREKANRVSEFGAKIYPSPDVDPPNPGFEVDDLEVVLPSAASPAFTPGPEPDRSPAPTNVAVSGKGECNGVVENPTTVAAALDRGRPKAEAAAQRQRVLTLSTSAERPASRTRASA